jgi:hypothetical protein
VEVATTRQNENCRLAGSPLEALWAGMSGQSVGVMSDTRRLDTPPGRRKQGRHASPDLMDCPFHMLRAALAAGQHHLFGFPQIARAQINALLESEGGNVGS